ncbi:signal peptidase I [Nonomuraea sp. KM90]|uniref:signal peptidase I n=1 Tax=Nonomuraea sp. KM90 TaxID=3457428 RepID=UPI003FCE9DF3
MIRRLPAVLILVLLTANCTVVDSAFGTLTITWSSQSMEPTIKQGTKVSARRTEGGYTPRRGDIIVYRAPEDWTAHRAGGTYLSRVIGVPGDRVACCDNPSAALQVNGVLVKEPFITRGAALARWFDITVPPDRIWVMSDNRDIALDSRAEMDKAGGGTIERSAVLAVVEDEDTHHVP